MIPRRRPKSRRQFLAMLTLALLTAHAALPASAAGEQAIPSQLAEETLLLDVARADGRLVAVGEWGHVLLSDDDGKSWRQAGSVPTRVTLTDVTFADGQRGWAVGHDAVVLHTRDGGESWELQYQAPEEEVPLLSVWFENAERGLAAGGFAMLLETTDGGETWQRRPLGANSEDDYHLNAIFPGPGESLFIAAEAGSIYRSLDGGASWERLHPPYRGSFWGGLSLDGEAFMVFGMRGHLFRSDDLGESWRELATGTDQSLQSATIRADGRIVVVGLGGVVLTSSDGGRSFSAAIEPDRRGIAAAAEGADGRLLLFGETGVKTR
jgi:photosystem II stability/assembly factor-like uncharacterized protein